MNFKPVLRTATSPIAIARAEMTGHLMKWLERKHNGRQTA